MEDEHSSDIHKPVEQALQSQLAIFRALIEHSSDVIIISDENGIERYISPSITNVLGYEPNELLSRSQYLLHHPDDRDRVRNIFFGFVKSRSATPISFSWRFLHKDGDWRWIEATASNQLDNPLIQGIILNFRDISERKRFEESLRQAKEKAEADALEIERNNLEIRLKNRDLKKLNEEKNELLQVVSHDLKNPLYNLQHEARAILTSPGQTERHTRRVLQCADTMLDLINNFLSIHAIESGRLTLQIEPVDVNAQLDRVLSGYGETLKRKSVNLLTDRSAEPAIALTDAAALTQILDNLVSNALKYSPPGGRVFVSVTTYAGAVTVRVQDEGVGIPLDEVDRLFQKFTRLSTKPTAGESSNGLGLAIARKLVKLLQADIWYEHHPGKGATFVVELPATTLLTA